MISRSAISRAAKAALRRQTCAARSGTSSRSFAAAAASAPSSATFEATTVSGVTVVTKDPQGPATKLAIVAKAGTRYQPLPGLTAGLEGYAFKNTLRRSALRITRESELLGGQLTAYHTREALVLEANFLREHLPYFTELLSEVVSQTTFTRHELEEDIEPVLHIKQAKYAADVLALALDGAHTAAFHTGLGHALYPTAATPLGGYLEGGRVAAFAEAAYAPSNFAVVADGATQVALSKWVDQFFKKSASPATASLPSAASKYYGGQQRSESSAGHAIVIAFPTASAINAPDATSAVLTALLGGVSNIKWTPGFTLLAKAAASVSHGAQISAQELAYSDAALLTIQATGPSAAVVSAAAAEAVKALQAVADGSAVTKETLAKAVSKAKFDALTAQEPGVAAVTIAGTAVLHGTQPTLPAATSKAFEAVTVDKVKTLAKKLLDGKASFSAVGDLYALPYAEDLGLKV